MKQGDKLVSFDREAIAEDGYDTTIAVLVTNSGNYKKVLAIPGRASSADTCIEIQQ